jgi:hypothetical protein
MCEMNSGNVVNFAYSHLNGHVFCIFYGLILVTHELCSCKGSCSNLKDLTLFVRK